MRPHSTYLYAHFSFLVLASLLFVRSSSFLLLPFLLLRLLLLLLLAVAVVVVAAVATHELERRYGNDHIGPLRDPKT